MCNKSHKNYPVFYGGYLRNRQKHCYQLNAYADVTNQDSIRYRKHRLPFSEKPAYLFIFKLLISGKECL